MTGESDATQQRIERALRDLTPRDEQLTAPPPDLWDRITSELADEEARPPGGPAHAATHDADAGPPVARSIGAKWASRRSVLAAAAAVILVIAGIVGVLVTRSGDDPGEVVARVTLSSKGLAAPQPARGAAQLERDGREWMLDLQAADLPTSKPGYFYEVWLLGQGTKRVQSLGTLDRHGEYLVPTGIDISKFPIVDVSVEPIDGNPNHSGKSVLRGSLHLN